MASILHIATGGTIASTQGADGGVVTTRSGESLFAGIALPDHISVTTLGFAAKGSNLLTLAMIHDLAKVIERELPRYDGVVITHGTDTMEETAYALEILLAPGKPVVITGAQRHAEARDADGPRNLADAVIAAADPVMAGVGVVVLFEGDIHAARRVRKVHSSRTDAFRSGDFGKLGAVDDGHVSLTTRPARLPALGLDHAPVEIGFVASAMGMGPELLDFMATSAVAGVVVQGMGRGNFPSGWGAAVGRLVQAGKPVVITSRCTEGHVAAIYGDEGGGTQMAEMGALFGGDLNSFKMRVLLSFLLPQKPQDLGAAIAPYIA